MNNQNQKTNETDNKTDHISEMDEDQTQLLMDAIDEKTELLSHFNETAPPHFSEELDDATELLLNEAAHEQESGHESGLNDDSVQHTNADSDDFAQSDSVNSSLDNSSVDEPTEELLDEDITKTKKRKKLYVGIGAVTGISLLIALAFFIPAQMKVSEINKSLDLGEKYLEEGKYEEAIIAFDDVVAIEPKQVAAYEGKGSANIGLKNYTEAETQLETAKTIDYTDNGKVLMSDVYINTERKEANL